MTTYRITPPEFPHSFLLDATSIEVARLRGALFIISNPVLGRLRGDIQVDPWFAQISTAEYLPASFFADIEDPLRRLFDAAKTIE